MDSHVSARVSQSPIKTRENLLHSLKGTTFVVPDLHKSLAHWPQDTHPAVDRLSQVVEERLKMFFPTGKISRKMQEAKVANFAASWWPYASFDRLCTATYLSLWLFAWDDQSDSSEISDIVTNSDSGALFRQETKEFIHASLLSNESQPLPEEKSPFIASFGEVGRAIAKSCTPEQRQRFLQELDLFLDMTDLEQRVFSSNKLPTVAEYLRRRMGSSAVGVCLAITEYAYAMKIPPPALNEAPIRRLWNLTNMIISTTNDILSLKKEISHGQTDSLIPLLYAETGYASLQQAVDIAAHIVSSCVAEFDEISGQLEIPVQSYDEREKNGDCEKPYLHRFIDGCRYACTANLNWGLCSERYRLDSRPPGQKGGFLVTL